MTQPLFFPVFFHIFESEFFLVFLIGYSINTPHVEYVFIHVLMLGVKADPLFDKKCLESWIFIHFEQTGKKAGPDPTPVLRNKGSWFKNFYNLINLS